MSFLLRKYNERKIIEKKIDPIITELTKESRGMAISVDGKPLKVPLVRGGQIIEKTSLRFLVIKNKTFFAIVKAVMNARRHQRLLKLLQIHLFIINTFLNSSLGVRFAVGGSFDFTQFVLIFFPASFSGFIIAQVIANPIGAGLLPLAILYGRVEDVLDPSENCLVWCKLAEQFHNEKFVLEMAEMTKLEAIVKNPSIELPKPFVCVENPLSIVQRFSLRSSLESDKARNQVKYFRDFIKKVPECDVDPDTVYEAVVGKITK
jgi:hypothetical protein